MKTNLEKWNFWLNLIKKEEDKFIKSEVKIMPTKIYQVRQNGNIGEGIITRVYYSHMIDNKHIWLSFYGNKPSREDVLKLKEYYELKIPLIKKKILFSYEEKNGKYKTSGAHFLFDNTKNQRLTLNKDEAKAMSAEIISKNIKEAKFINLHKKDADYNYTENGYKFLGWQNGWKSVYYDEDHNLCSETGRPSKYFGYLTEDYPEYGKCRDLKHQTIEVSHNGRGSENTVSCPICKIYWKYDCSD